MCYPVSETDFFQCFQSPLRAFLCIDTGINERKLDIFYAVEAGKQIKGLKNKADFTVADACKFIVVQFRDIFSVEFIPAGRRSVEAADNIHQG